MAHTYFIAYIEIGSDSTIASTYIGRARERRATKLLEEKRREKERQLSSGDTERLYYIHVRV